MKVILITKRKENHWIFPKGQQENKMSLKAVARMESEEEAGIRGKISGAPIRIPYDRSGGMQNLIVYPMEVSKILNNWRKRESGEGQSSPLKKPMPSLTGCQSTAVSSIWSYTADSLRIYRVSPSLIRFVLNLI